MPTFPRWDTLTCVIILVHWYINALTQIQQPLVPLVDEFAARLFSELDYVQEGRNCERFAKLYANVPRVRTPTICWEATSRRVITMQWIGAA